MPRKQNGFGSANSFAFKGSGRVDKGKGTGAFGFYPSNRRFGTSVHRTVIENWNLNSDWTKWRKGYELYNFAAYSTFNVFNQEYNPGLPISKDNQDIYLQRYGHFYIKEHRTKLKLCLRQLRCQLQN